MQEYIAPILGFIWSEHKHRKRQENLKCIWEQIQSLFNPLSPNEGALAHKYPNDQEYISFLISE